MSFWSFQPYVTVAERRAKAAKEAAKLKKQGRALSPVVVKGMVTPLDILAPGGSLIVASACSEGFGSAEFRDAQAKLVELGPERFLATLTAKTLAEVDEWQTEMQLKPMRLGRIALHTSGLHGEDRRLTGVEMIDDLAGAVSASIVRSGDPHVAVIPEGPYVVPRYAP